MLDAGYSISEGRCEDCEHSVPAGGLTDLTLICNHKADTDLPWQVVAPDDSCPNFEPARELVPPDITAALAEGARLLPLSQNKFAIVDADDYERLNKYKWCVSKTRHTNYAMRRTKGKRVKGKRVKRKTIMMHRFILNAPRGLVVDHINHNGLDNRKSNLRLCTRAENSYNSRSFNNKSSKYKGVSGQTKKTFRRLHPLQWKMLQPRPIQITNHRRKGLRQKGKRAVWRICVLEFSRLI